MVLFQALLKAAVMFLTVAVILVVTTASSNKVKILDGNVDDR